jgi:hypothetical protein
MNAISSTTKVRPAAPRQRKWLPFSAEGRGAVSNFTQTWLETPAARVSRVKKSKRPDIPSTELLLSEGGDGRIVCGPDGSNPYGCSSVPEPDVLAYGSSTASTISVAGFKAADALQERLVAASLTEPSHITYEREVGRLRRELTGLCGLEGLSGLEIILGASGTDLHLFASQLILDAPARVPLVIRVEAEETGRGVPDALAGRHFGDCAALGDVVTRHVPLDCGRPVEIVEVKCRTAEGNPRPVETVDAEVEKAVVQAATRGRRVLLTLVDVSKTGLLAPSPACADALRNRFPDLVEVLVDACQFRLSPSTLRAYLEHDFLVAITGSKFVTGPTFCGALLVPKGPAQRLKKQSLPHALRSYSTRADWPQNWTARSALKSVANYGLLLRWEAAMTELRAFRALPESAITQFLLAFEEAVLNHLANGAAFEIVPVPTLNRGSVAPVKNWDCVPTIFSFLLARRSESGKRTWLNRDETKRVHQLLLSSLCQVGQPVPCGIREGIPVSALRLCTSTRLIVDALSPNGRGASAIVTEALMVLDKAAYLASRMAT